MLPGTMPSDTDPPGAPPVPPSGAGSAWGRGGDDQGSTSPVDKVTDGDANADPGGTAAVAVTPAAESGDDGFAPVSLVKDRPAEPAEATGWEYDPPPPAATPPLDPTFVALRQVFLIIALLALGFLVELTLLGGLQHDRNQAQSFAELRIQLADGTASVGPTDFEGRILEAGTPVAILEIPRIGVSEVVLEGPSSRVTMSGPGHQRDSVMPGQIGTSVVLGRRGGYAGPFRELDRLVPGDEIIATTGQGRHAFTVLGLRRAGDPLPPPLVQGSGRMVLATTDGPVYQPTGVLYVDADLTTPAQARPAQIPRGAAPENETIAAGDPSVLLPLLLWGLLLVGSAIAVVWVSHRVGRWQAWIIGVPVLGLFGSLAIDSAAALLPNIL